MCRYAYDVCCGIFTWVGLMGCYMGCDTARCHNQQHQPTISVNREKCQIVSKSATHVNSLGAFMRLFFKGFIYNPQFLGLAAPERFKAEPPFYYRVPEN